MRRQQLRLFSHYQQQQAGLQSLTIASRSWTDTTYAAAANVETLRTIVVKVEIQTEAGAALVANLVHPGSVQVLIGCCHQRCPSAFLLLSSGQAKITVLELWHIDANQCSRLQTMSSLHEMTLMKPQLIAMNTISRLLHSFAATADRLATDQLLAAD